MKLINYMKTVDHIAVLVENLEISQKWYEDVCGAKLVFEDHKYKRMEMNNTTIALIDKKYYKYAHFGITVDSTKDFPEGGEVVPHRDGTTGCYIKDPDGNVVEFIHYSTDMKKEIGLDEI